MSSKSSRLSEFQFLKLNIQMYYQSPQILMSIVSIQMNGIPSVRPNKQIKVVTNQG